MEYGYFITNADGTKKFFVEGCTYCSMSTGGQHELCCPLYKPASTFRIVIDEKQVEPDRIARLPNIKAIREDEAHAVTKA